MLMMSISRQSILICSFYILMVMLAADGYVGINWGRIATQRMIPSMVVDIMLQNNITNVRTFSSSRNVLEAFGGTNIGVDVSIPGPAMKTINTTSDAEVWLANNIKPYLDINVTFRYIYVGTAVLSGFTSKTTQEQAIRTLKVVQKALENNNIPGVKATFSQAFYDILVLPLTKPSMAEILPDLKEKVIQYCKIIEQSKTPFGLDIYPLGAPVSSLINDMEFAFFENNSTEKFTDGEFFYRNVVELIYDSVAVALEKIGCHVPIFIGAIGWPTDGLKGANLQNAERFHQGLAKFVRSQKGTPRRPGNIDTYIHNIADENAVSAKAGPFMRHWGIYKFDGQPKFNLDFTGNERKVKPVSAVGISHMPKRWCVLDASKINPNQIPFETLDAFYNMTCSLGDCTSMATGGSCSELQFPTNYSYAFNAGFQYAKQNVQGNNACDYGGFGMLVVDDPSTQVCTFPIEIIAAETVNFLGQH